uniref:EGF-like domain-containing protein n=1 Tax=Magallana gigas TaxID=29159 RepID=A0A8W8NS93_MAGGI
MQTVGIGVGTGFPVKTVWWKVDLGEVYSIYSINIQFRNFDGYGCNNASVYGSNCDIPCPANCKDNTCHIQSGACSLCKPGWTGVICNTKCREGWYGINCSQQCSGHCRDDTPCNHVTGQCENKCAAGWTGLHCNKECINGHYGYNCVNKCSGHCLNNSPCNKQTGQCDKGCNLGYTGNNCSKDKADHLLTNHDVQSSTNFVIGLSISISLNIILIVCGIELCSPVQRLMSRRTRHSLPTTAALLELNISTNTHRSCTRDNSVVQQYDKHTKNLSELQTGQNVKMKKHPKYWQFGTCTQSLENRSYLIEFDRKSYRRNRGEIRPTKEAHDAERTDPLPYKPEDDPLVITNERPQNESVKQPIAPQPQTAFGSSRETTTSPASDNKCAVNASTKVRSSSRNAKLPSKFKNYIMT